MKPEEYDRESAIMVRFADEIPGLGKDMNHLVVNYQRINPLACNYVRDTLHSAG